MGVCISSKWIHLLRDGFNAGLYICSHCSRVYYDIQNILWLIIVSAEHSVYILSSYCAHGYSVYLVYMIC
jgi:hypothetical protein